MAELPPLPTWRQIRSSTTVYFWILKQNLSTLGLRNTFLSVREEVGSGGTGNTKLISLVEISLACQ